MNQVSSNLFVGIYLLEIIPQHLHPSPHHSRMSPCVCVGGGVGWSPVGIPLLPWLSGPLRSSIPNSLDMVIEFMTHPHRERKSLMVHSFALTQPRPDSSGMSKSECGQYLHDLTWCF